MNKRQKKKFVQKNKHKSIKNAYISLLISRVGDRFSDLCDGSTLIQLTIGKKNKAKPYITSAKLYTNIRLADTQPDMIIQNDDVFTIETAFQAYSIDLDKTCYISQLEKAGEAYHE